MNLLLSHYNQFFISYRSNYVAVKKRKKERNNFIRNKFGKKDSGNENLVSR